MGGEEQFDSFYLATRRDLVHQTFALTGDLPAAQGAVRDAYVAAWHHWRKVSVLEDPLAWVRPHAWSLAQRRHTARIWYRTKDVPDEVRALLDALGKLAPSQRRALLLTQLAALSLADAAREMAVTQDVAARELQAAMAGLAVALDTDSVTLRSRLLELHDQADRVTLPRAPIIRRAGRKRRQVHTVLATAAAAVLAIGSGAFAYQPTDAGSDVPVETTPAAPAPAPAAPAETLETQTTETEATEPPLPTAEDLLDDTQISRLGRGEWRVVDTHDNTSGNGINTVCQASRFADPDGVAALVRTFEANRKPARDAVQTVEVSRSEEQAERAYETTVGWYAGCRAAGLQLVGAYRIGGVGDEARALLLRSWREPVTTHSVAVARLGRLVTSTVTSTVGTDAPPPKQVAQSLADSASMLCASSAGEECATIPDIQRAAPPLSGDERGILAAVDLPPVGRITRPWVGTEATGGAGNPAATVCDNAGFVRAGAQRTRSRTFLIPGAKVPKRFGLTETYGVFRSPRAAGRFVDEVRDRIAGCEDRNLAANVRNPRALHLTDPRMHVFTWDVETDISDQKSVMFRTGLVRTGNAVAQVTFSPAPEQDMSGKHFRDLVVRAGNRLRELD